MFLATTGLDQFWDESQEILFLGPWCLIPDHLDDWERKKRQVLTSPWADRQRFHSAVRYIDAFYERTLDHLADYLNTFHDVSLSTRYWRILIGKWLSDYLSQFYDRYVCLTEAFKLNPSLQTFLLPHDFTFHDKPLNQFANRHLPKLKRYSELLVGMGYDFPARAVEQDWLDSWTLPTETALKAYELPKATHPMPPILISWMRCPALMEQLLAERLGPKVLRDSIQDSWLPICASTNGPHREELSSVPSKGEFERLAVESLTKYFPAQYLEGYHLIRAEVLNRYPECPKLVVSGFGWQESEAFRFLAAESAERGNRIMAVQHGAIYGTYRSLPNRVHEQRISDVFVAWGWGDETTAKQRNLPCLHTSFYLEQRLTDLTNEAEDILYVVNQIVPYFSDFRSAIKSYGSNNYLEWQLRFLSALPAELYPRVLLRFKKAHQLEIWEHISRRFPGVRIESREIPFYERVQHCRLIVADCCTQVYTEAMMARPTILFWDPVTWETNDQAEPYFQNLGKVGILWSSPEAAAAKVVASYEDPWLWWGSKEVQKAKHLFLNHFALPHTNWSSEWGKALNAELALSFTAEKRPSKTV